MPPLDLVTWNRPKISIPIFALVISSLMGFFTQITSANEPAIAIPIRLIISSITLDSAIVPVGWKKVEIEGQTYGQWLADDNLVGWHNLSAPLGQPGNTVLNGHSNTYAKVFQNLHRVQIGDEISAFSGDQVYRYRVVYKLLVQEKGVSMAERLENAQLIMPTPDERLTLITCSYPGATHRLIIIAYPTTKVVTTALQ